MVKTYNIQKNATKTFVGNVILNLCGKDANPCSNSRETLYPFYLDNYCNNNKFTDYVSWSAMSLSTASGVQFLCIQFLYNKTKLIRHHGTFDLCSLHHLCKYMKQ